MNHFVVLLKKELRELVTWQTLLPLIITVILFAGLGKVIGSEVKREQTAQPIIVLDHDRSAASTQLKQAINQNHFTVVDRDEATVGAIPLQDFPKVKLALVIPAGFGQAVISNHSPTLETYTIQRSFSATGLVGPAMLKGVLEAVNGQLSQTLIADKLPGSDPASLRIPIASQSYVIVGDKTAQIDPNVVATFISSQTTFIPIILFVVILFAAQMVATAIANEKENKTLETLLSTPVSRQSIVAAKMLAAGIVAGISSLIYMLGLRNFQSGLTGGQAIPQTAQPALHQLGLVMTPLMYVVIGLALFLGILGALAIALILGAFAENVKSIQALLTPLTVLLLIPYVFTLILDWSTLPTALHVLIYAIPFSYPFLAAQNLFLHQYHVIAYGMIYQLLFFLAFVWLAARLFSSEQIVGLKLNFDKLNKLRKLRR